MDQLNIQDVFAPKLVQQNARFSSRDNLVLLTFDDNYVDQSINLILSIAAHHPTGVSFVCICPELKQENVQQLLALEPGIRLQCFAYTPAVDTGRWSPCAVFRLFCPWLLEEEIKRVLYMDSDILCTGSLDALFALEVPCIAMANEISGNVSSTQEETFRKDFPTQIYCNSGVVVFNLDYMRQNCSFTEIYDALCSLSGKVGYLDQDFLNAYFMGRITYLDAFHYNFQAYEVRRTRMYNKAVRYSKLVHFSVGKPWTCKSDLRLTLLYLKHSRHPAMIRRVRKAFCMGLLYRPCANFRRILGDIKYTFVPIP